MKALEFSDVQTRDLSLFSGRIEQGLMLVQQLGAELASIRTEFRCLTSNLCIPSRDPEQLIPTVSSDAYMLSMEALKDLVDSVLRDACRLEAIVNFLPKSHLAAAEAFKDVHSALVTNEAKVVDSIEDKNE